MEALAIRPDDHIVAIASGGCNVMSYLTANPARITAVDLNGAHIALNRLKLRAARDLPDYEAFHRFFAQADRAENVAAYDRWIKPNLNPVSRAYWEGRTTLGRRRVERFARNFSLWVAWILHRRRAFAGARAWQGSARNAAGRLARRAARPVRQRARAAVRNALGPLARSATRDALWPRHSAGAISRARRRRGGGMIDVLRDRLRRLACDFDFSSNYFARQAFGRGYGADEGAATPPYLEKGPSRRFARARTASR